MNIMAGESATITYATSNADTVEHQRCIGTVANQWNSRVSSRRNHELHADRHERARPCDLQPDGASHDRCCASRRLLHRQSDEHHLRQLIDSLWSVENAQTVTISGIGTVPADRHASSKSDGDYHLHVDRNQCGRICKRDCGYHSHGGGGGDGGREQLRRLQVALHRLRHHPRRAGRLSSATRPLMPAA